MAESQKHNPETLAVPPAQTKENSPTSSPGDDGNLEKGTDDAHKLMKVPTNRPSNPIAWSLVVLSILSSTFLFALDNTVVADVQPAIVNRFQSIDKLPWLSVAFLLGAASTNLIWGKIYGQFNAKWLYLGTTLLFEVGSAICGAAPSMTALIIGRALAGVGGAGMYVGVMTLLSVNTTEQERPSYIGLTGLTWGAGTVLGPIIGGAFTQSKVGWRWAFYINLFVFAVFVPVYIFMLPSFTPRPGVSLQKRLKHIDFLGTALIIGAFICGTMAIAFGGILYPWKNARVIVLFVLSALFFITLGFQQAFCWTTNEYDRIFPVQFLKSRTMLILYAQIASASSAIFVAIYFIPLFFQFVKGDDALEAGVRLLPLIVFLVVFCLVNGGVLSKVGLYMPWYLVGGILVVAGGALMFTVDENTSPAKIYGYSILLGTGAGCYVQASFSVAQASVPPADIPSSIGFITSGQITGVTICLAIANSIFLNQSATKIGALLPDASVEDIKSAITGTGSAFFNTLSEDMKKQVLHIIIESISRTFILALTAGCLSVVLAIFMKRERIFMAAPAAG
ncbi:MAG: hypothetical protein M1814_002736 [Vezdaea aestivalis]|nr:MAG: hypothetical protein M1814_002736 [Vezdaea aestivalis]